MLKSRAMQTGIGNLDRLFESGTDRGSAGRQWLLGASGILGRYCAVSRYRPNDIFFRCSLLLPLTDYLRVQAGARDIRISILLLLTRSRMAWRASRRIQHVLRWVSGCTPQLLLVLYSVSFFINLDLILAAAHSPGLGFNLTDSGSTEKLVQNQ